MISITKDELSDMRQIGTGKFGTVYQKDDDTAYKIYHPYVYDYSGKALENPALSYPRFRFNRLKRNGKNLKYTDIFHDVIYVDGHFGGISIPYYEGKTLNKMLDVHYPLKMSIAKKLIKCGKELTDNNIYPLDYKLNNIIYSGGEVKILDLDDYFTHATLIRNPLYFAGAVNGLQDSIYTFLGEYDSVRYGSRISSQLQRKRKSAGYKYEELDSYMREKEIPRNYLFINSDSDISLIKKQLQNKEFRVILSIDVRMSEEDLSEFIRNLKNNGIILYDIIFTNEIDHFVSNNCIDSSYEISNKSLIKVIFLN